MPLRRIFHAKRIELRAAPRKLRHRRCCTSECYARLRTIGSRRAGANPDQRTCAHLVDFADKALSALVWRHERPARTQCLTSAAYCLCPHPISLAPLSPIPKLASALAACQSTSVNRKSAYPTDPRTLKTAPFFRPKAAWLSDGLRYPVCPLTRIQDAPNCFRPILGKSDGAEKTRNDYRSASRLYLQVKYQTT